LDDGRRVAGLGEALGEVLLVDREVGQPRVVERADRAALLGKRRAELFPELAQLFQPAVDPTVGAAPRPVGRAAGVFTPRAPALPLAGGHDRPTRIVSSSTIRDASRSRSTG